MRLINTSSLLPESNTTVPTYAILSHRWAYDPRLPPLWCSPLTLSAVMFGDQAEQAGKVVEQSPLRRLVSSRQTDGKTVQQKGALPSVECVRAAWQTSGKTLCFPPSSRDWAILRGEIERLVGYGEDIPAVRDKLESDFGFRTNERMIKSRLKQWGTAERLEVERSKLEKLINSQGLAGLVGLAEKAGSELRMLGSLNGDHVGDILIADKNLRAPDVQHYGVDMIEPIHSDSNAELAAHDESSSHVSMQASNESSDEQGGIEPKPPDSKKPPDKNFGDTVLNDNAQAHFGDNYFVFSDSRYRIPKTPSEGEPYTSQCQHDTSGSAFDPNVFGNFLEHIVGVLRSTIQEVVSIELQKGMQNFLCCLLPVLTAQIQAVHRW